MSVIALDGAQFSDIDNYLINALALSAVTGRAFEMKSVGKIAGTEGITPLHLTAIRALARSCEAQVKGEAIGAKNLRFVPQAAPTACDLVLDSGEATGRPSPEAITPIIEALIPVLARAGESSFVRLRGANFVPSRPSAFWLRETLAPMLALLGIEAAIEIERWGWYPDGGGETTLLVEGGWSHDQIEGSLLWEERGDAVGLWALIALSPRLEERLGRQMRAALEKELGREPLGTVEIEVARVRSPGPGSGLFLALQSEQVTAGFEAISHRGTGAEPVVQEAMAALGQYFWSDSAFDPELARAMMIPLALSGREARFTTSDLTLPIRILEYLLPRFLPVSINVSKHPKGGQIEIQPTAQPLQ